MRLIQYLSSFLLVSVTTIAGPSRLEERADLPVIDLPYGSFRASRYNKINDMYVHPP